MASHGGPASAGPPGAGSWPAGFSVAQGARAERVLDGLWAVARAKRVPLAGRVELGRLIQAHPDTDHVSEAAAFMKHWLLGDGAGSVVFAVRSIGGLGEP